MNDPIVALLIEEFKERSRRGQEKYGTTLARQDLSKVEWLHHARDEAMDLALYLQRLIEMEVHE